MSDHGRLTAKDRREIREGARLLRHDATVSFAGIDTWREIIRSTWEWWAWEDEDPANIAAEGARILESLLMTDRRFR